MSGVNLKAVTQCTYLGVHFSNDMSWNHHINHILKDASRILGFIRRNLSRCDTEVKAAAYKALVRPKLEYAASVWDPHQSNLINKIEMVQRRAARFVVNDYRRITGVTDHVNSLNWPPLQERRKVSRLSIFHKAIHQEAAVNIPTYVKKSTRPMRGDPDRYTPLQCRTKAYLNSFLPHTLKDWNNLPFSTKNSNTHLVFKNQLNKDLLKLN